MSVDHVAGYGSVFGDGVCLRLDLCLHCTKTLLECGFNQAIFRDWVNDPELDGLRKTNSFAVVFRNKVMSRCATEKILRPMSSQCGTVQHKSFTTPL